MNEGSTPPAKAHLQPGAEKRGPVKLAVIMVLAIHVVGLIALLIQGSRMPAIETAVQDGATNALPVFETPPNSPIASETKPPPPIEAESETAKASNMTPTGMKEYKIAKGDTFQIIARKFHITVQAIEVANRGVKATKLKIGQSIQIPTAAATANQGDLVRR
jgi:LysM repeat protein